MLVRVRGSESYVPDVIGQAVQPTLACDSASPSLKPQSEPQDYRQGSILYVPDVMLQAVQLTRWLATVRAGDLVRVLCESTSACTGTGIRILRT